MIVDSSIGVVDWLCVCVQMGMSTEQISMGVHFQRDLLLAGRKGEGLPRRPWR